VPATDYCSSTTTSGLEVSTYHDDDSRLWREYVTNHPAATVFHDLAWKRVIERAFRYKARYLMARQGTLIRGVLPLFLVESRLFGRRMISTPFAVYGGICADDETAESALYLEACRLTRLEGADYLELRDRKSAGYPGLQSSSLYVTFEKDLTVETAALFDTLPRNTRNMIRKGRKHGLRAVFDNRHVDRFYDVYAQSVHHLGSPVFAESFFHIIKEEFANAAEITTIWLSNRTVAAVLSFRFRDWLLPYYGGSTMEGRSVAANNFMYWEIMRAAAEQNLRHFDFGRSKLGTGAHDFKTRWNMRERPLNYGFYLHRRATVPNFTPANRHFHWGINLWKRLPFCVAKTLGPAVIHLFP